MRQNGKCHVLERDRCAVEQLQIVNTVCFCQRCNFLCVKFCIVCVCNTVFQFIFCKVGKKTAHYLVCHFLIAHSRKFSMGTSSAGMEVGTNNPPSSDRPFKIAWDAVTVSPLPLVLLYNTSMLFLSFTLTPGRASLTPGRIRFRLVLPVRFLLL